MPCGHVGQREPALLAGDLGVEDDLEQQVPELSSSATSSGASARRRGQPVEHVEDLVGLLQQVAAGEAVGLGPVPGAAAPQRAHQLLEARSARRHRRRQPPDPQAGEVVGADRSVQVRPRHRGDRLVGQAQALQDDDRLVGASSTASLMSESTSRVSHWATSSGPPLAGGLDGEALPVDQPHAGRQRVDAEAGPGQVEERQGRFILDLDPVDPAAARRCARPPVASRARRRRPRPAPASATSRSTIAG